jgi:hypothetical protein
VMSGSNVGGEGELTMATVYDAWKPKTVAEK